MQMGEGTGSSQDRVGLKNCLIGHPEKFASETDLKYGVPHRMGSPASGFSCVRRQTSGICYRQEGEA